MFNSMRLTDLHDARAAALERASRYTRYMPKLGAEAEAEALDAEIRARVAAQEIGIPFLVPGFSLDVARQNFPTDLAFGIPDAIRKYPGRYDHWAYHARHAVPVEGCHLCHPQPTRWTPGGFVHEEHIPGEGRQ